MDDVIGEFLPWCPADRPGRTASGFGAHHNVACQKVRTSRTSRTKPTSVAGGGEIECDDVGGASHPHPAAMDGRNPPVIDQHDADLGPFDPFGSQRQADEPLKPLGRGPKHGLPVAHVDDDR